MRKDELIKALQTLPKRDDDLNCDYLDYATVADFIIKRESLLISGLNSCKRIFERMEYSPCCKADGVEDYNKFKKALKLFIK